MSKFVAIALILTACAGGITRDEAIDLARYSDHLAECRQLGLRVAGDAGVDAGRAAYEGCKRDGAP